MNRFELKTPVIDTAVVISIATVFVTDAATPLGVAVWVFYLVPITLSLYVWHPRRPLIVAAVSTVLVATGYLLSPPPLASVARWVFVANRTMITVSLWAMALVAHQFIRNKLRLAEQEWIRSAQTQLSERLQGEKKVSELGDAILRFLCPYLGAHAAALYSVEQDGTIRRRATYASESSNARELVASGEGLIGQAVKDARVMRLDDVPPDYLPISSGLGKTNPRGLLIVPMQSDGVVLGVIELGFLHAIGHSDMDLLQTVAEPVAVAIRSAHYRTRQAELLEETQRQAAELQAQQEELRVANEELEEQSHSLQHSQSALEKQQSELEHTNAQLEEQTRVLEYQRDELSKTQSELLRNAEDLARSNQYKSEFLANMSHELRTPLNSALILARLLADNKGGNLTPEQVKYASTIYSAGNDLLVLINDILDLSRVEAGRLELHVEPVEVRRTVESLEATFQPLARDKGLAFHVEVAADAPAVIHSDGLRLEQVLRNLLSNAFKFTEAGRVSLRIAASGQNRVSFAVSDTGIGIAPDRLQVIFEAFRQADGTTSRRYGGTGLGLTISRELARRLGGGIAVESTPGGGSTFTLTLPVVLESKPEPVRPSPQRQVSAPLGAPQQAAARGSEHPTVPVDDDRGVLKGGERSILVVEDDEAFAAILRDVAREQRFRAIVATSASEAVRLARELVPSAILLDIHLPDDSGLAVLEQLKHTPATRHIPVHVVSAVDYTQQALEMGAIGYALKPVQREQILDAIGKLEQRLDQKLRRVLVVEDVAMQRDSIVQLLRGENTSIEAVGTGAEALRRLRDITFDCMVLDLTLPDMSGYDLLDKLAAGEAFSFPPVIVYTGHELSRDEEDRLHRYASSIIIKGAKSPERLLDEVTLFLHQVEGMLPAEQQRILREVRNREAALEGKNVLVVDDDARNIFALASVLESKGSKVRLARNGREAISALETASGDGNPGVDLVLMDIMMPEMDGLTAIREIRKRPGWKKLPIIALTAKAMPKDRDDCLGAGADDYVAKPLDIDKLLSLVKVWIPK